MQSGFSAGGGGLSRGGAHSFAAHDVLAEVVVESVDPERLVDRAVGSRARSWVSLSSTEYATSRNVPPTSTATAGSMTDPAASYPAFGDGRDPPGMMATAFVRNVEAGGRHGERKRGDQQVEMAVPVHFREQADPIVGVGASRAAGEFP